MTAIEEIRSRGENEKDNAPPCKLCGTRPSTHRCHACSRFVCERCLAPRAPEPLSKLLTDQQTDAFFLSILSSCRDCADEK